MSALPAGTGNTPIGRSALGPDSKAYVAAHQQPRTAIESDTGRSALAAGTAESAPFAAVRGAASKPQKSRRSESCKIAIALDLPALLPERTSIRLFGVLAGQVRETCSDPRL